MSTVFFLMARNIREQNHSGMPSRAFMAKEISTASAILGGEPKYANRQIRRTMNADVPLNGTAFVAAREAIEAEGWHYVTAEKGTYFMQYKYCRGRLAFTFEVIEEKRLIYGVTWESQPRSFAYCE